MSDQQKYKLIQVEDALNTKIICDATLNPDENKTDVDILTFETAEEALAVIQKIHEGNDISDENIVKFFKQQNLKNIIWLIDNDLKGDMKGWQLINELIKNNLVNIKQITQYTSNAFDEFFDNCVLENNQNIGNLFHPITIINEVNMLKYPWKSLFINKAQFKDLDNYLEWYNLACQRAALT